jgi:hypothetical protein
VPCYGAFHILTNFTQPPATSFPSLPPPLSSIRKTKRGCAITGRVCSGRASVTMTTGRLGSSWMRGQTRREASSSSSRRRQPRRGKAKTLYRSPPVAANIVLCPTNCVLCPLTFPPPSPPHPPIEHPMHPPPPRPSHVRTRALGAVFSYFFFFFFFFCPALDACFAATPVARGSWHT